MHCRFRHLASLLLTAALATPALMATSPYGQEREEHERDTHRRYYDPDHRDYHYWNDREDRAYRQWLEPKLPGI